MFLFSTIDHNWPERSARIQSSASFGAILACPFFLPTERADDLAFPHPARLPLGSSWRGTCSASGQEHAVVDLKELESCNLGYAKSCPRLPKDRAYDAVRFAVVSNSGEEILLQFVLEHAYLPAGHGILRFDQRSGTWVSPHPDLRIQKKAECFLQSYLERTNRL
jgi:hypothetical protein